MTQAGITPRKASLWWNLLGVAVSAGLVVAIILQLGGATSAVLKTISGLPPLVWPMLVLLYLTQPLCDYAVFRRLWNLPLAGIGALLRKTVINEVVLGYSGEAYLYVWARRVVGEGAFAAIKDVNIISALLSNLLTLALAAISITQLQKLDFAHRVGPALWSGLIPLTISMGVLLFGRRVFSLSRAALAHISLAHGIRLVVSTALLVLIWRMALPEVALGLWVVLLAIRYLISRLPVISNKDLVFGNLMLLLLGADSTVAVLQAALALMTLGLHLAVIVGLGAADLVRRLRGVKPLAPARRSA
ncbi:hypothetical protein [Caulobacter sp.]|uniref:hypothetical protein n=1 Tax=Caulobacter sp. TaxID=78 RepID=UPI001B2F7B73|nr:hypothetical protein [Caulobacter sp.]MBO9543489.1 hypothetical protein [Caulobacter sp.]